ncbi:energy-coupling factor transporter transmembrane component T [Maledivibacter halophilus]|nr:energy-coupling factor transporter transmembrane component T [Maledivibacter halophilus]
MKERKRLLDTLKITGYTAFFIIIVNPLVSKGGSLIIYKGIDLPVIGEIVITVEAIAFGAVMAIKLISIGMVFVLYSIINNPDDSFSFFSKYAHRLTLTLSMTTNIIHRLKLEVLRVKEVMILRGANFKGKKFIKKIKSYYPILKVILISSLEGSLNRAEALYSKGYGKRKRTMYSELRITGIDFIINTLNIIFIGIFIYGVSSQKAIYNFYPRLGKLNIEDILYLIILTAPILLILIIMGRYRNWKSSKYRI